MYSISKGTIEIMATIRIGEENGTCAAAELVAA